MLFQWLQRSYSLPGTPKHDFLEIHEALWFFEISCNFMKFLKFYPNFGFAGSLECQALQPLLFPKEYQGFVKGCEWLKTQKSWISLKTIKFAEFSWNFISFITFPQFHQFSALRRWHAKRTVIPMHFQWLQRSCFLPEHPKICFSWISWNFMKFREISWDSMKFLKFYPNSGFAGSLECQALQPLLFLRNIKVSWRVADGWKHQNHEFH